MQSEIGPVDVTVYAGLEPDGETYRRCRITVLGAAPISARLYKFWSGRWLPVDTITNASYSGTGDRGVFVGTSRALVVEVGLLPSNAEVRWDVNFVGCTSCG